MAYKKAAIAIPKVLAIVLTILAMGVISYGLFASEGIIMEGDRRFTDIRESTLGDMETIRDFSRENPHVDPRITESWQLLLAEIYAAKERDDDEFCIIPLRIQGFSDTASIRLMEGSGELLFSLGHRQSRGQAMHYETETIRGMSLSIGTFELDERARLDDEKYDDAERSMIDTRSFPFGRIVLEDADVIETAPEAFIKDREAPIEDAGDLGYTYQPLYAYDYHEYVEDEEYLKGTIDNYASKYSARLNPSDDWRANYGLILANNQKIVIIRTERAALQGEFPRINNMHYSNIMGPFGPESGIDGDIGGYEFCRRENNALLRPASGSCECSTAQNRAMCGMIDDSNCGVVCTWDDATDTCMAADEEKVDLLDAFAEMFAGLLEEIDDVCDGCTHFTHTSDEYSGILNSLVTNQELREFLSGATLSIGDGIVTVESDGITSNTHEFEAELPVAVVEGNTITSEVTLSHDGGVRLAGVPLESAETGEGVRLFLYYEKYLHDGLNLISPKTSRDIRDDFDNTGGRLRTDDDPHIMFFDTGLPYSLELAGEEHRCHQISNKDTCIFHQADGDYSCYWRTRDSSTETQCKPLISYGQEVDADEAREIRSQADAAGIEIHNVETHLYQGKDYPMELIDIFQEKIDGFGSCYDTGELDDLFSEYSGFDYEVHERKSKTAFFMVHNIEVQRILTRDEWYYNIVDSTEPIQEC